MADPKGLLVVPVAFRADGSIHALELDNSDRLKVLVDSITGTVTIDGVSQYIFRPAQRNTFFINGTLPAGTSNQTVLTVPAGETHRYTTVSFVYTGTVAGVTMVLFGYDGSNIWTVGVNNTPVSGNWVVFTCNMILVAGNTILVAVGGATLGDTLIVSAIGERIY